LKITSTVNSEEITEDKNEESSEPTILAIKSKIVFNKSPSSDNLILHWGVGFKGNEWNVPPEDMLPQDTKYFDKKAVQTKFSESDEIEINFKQVPERLIKSLNFVFHNPKNVSIYII
jgi:hypothetical protein